MTDGNGEIGGHKSRRPRHNVPAYFTSEYFLLPQTNMLSLTFLEITRDSLGMCFIFIMFYSDLSKKKKTPKNQTTKLLTTRKQWCTLIHTWHMIFGFSVGNNNRVVAMQLKWRACALCKESTSLWLSHAEAQTQDGHIFLFSCSRWKSRFLRAIFKFINVASNWIGQTNHLCRVCRLPNFRLLQRYNFISLPYHGHLTHLCHHSLGVQGWEQRIDRSLDLPLVVRKCQNN